MKQKDYYIYLDEQESDKSQELFFYGRSGNPYGKRTGKLDAATEKRRKK